MATMSAGIRKKMPGFSFSDAHMYERASFQDSIVELTNKNGRSPSVQEIAEHTGMKPDRVLGLFRIFDSTSQLSLDADLEQPLDVASDEDIAEEVAHMEAVKRAVALVLRDTSSLSTKQRAALSLRFGVFSASLKTSVIEHRGAAKRAFTYPDSEEAFLAFVAQEPSVDKLGALVLGRDGRAFSEVVSDALIKARRLLENNAIANSEGDTYSEQFAMDEAERQKIVELALQLQPEAPLSQEAITKLHKAGLFPGRETIKRLFSTTRSFQIACGFNLREHIKRDRFSKEEIVAAALEIQPDKPLTKKQINEFSADNKMCSVRTIYSHFGSLKAFQEACGFKIETKPRLTDEEVVAAALEIQPDKPLTTLQMETLSAAKKFNSATDIKNRFGSIKAFHRACGCGSS